jgi:hypothetical protein
MSMIMSWEYFTCFGSAYEAFRCRKTTTLATCSIMGSPCWSPPPQREIWLLTHPDIRNFARVDAVMRWIEGILAGSSP